MPQNTFGIFEVITLKVLWSPPWLGWPWWNICVTNDHEYVPLVVNTFRSFSPSWLIIGFVTRLTQRVPLIQQELLTLPVQLSSLRGFRGDSCYSISRFMCMLWINIGCNKMTEMELMYMNYNTKSIHGENTHTANN